jgi:hypothetical protein
MYNNLVHTHACMHACQFVLKYINMMLSDMLTDARFVHFTSTDHQQYPDNRATTLWYHDHGEHQAYNKQDVEDTSFVL